jgi:choline dehydrogenase-like flavoprotein
LLEASEDIEAFIAAFRDTVAPFFQKLKPYGFFDRWVCPMPEDFLTHGDILEDDKSNFNAEAFKKYLLDNVYGYHAAGTCKMGSPSDPLAVVDERGRVFGVQGLRVCDCSIFPLTPSSNPMMAAYMVGERMADLIKEDLRSSG